MKKLFMFMLSLMVLVACGKKTNASHSVDDESTGTSQQGFTLSSLTLKGHVRSVNTVCYDAREVFGRYEKGSVSKSWYWFGLQACRSQAEFNEHGQMTAHYMYDEADSLVSYFLYTFDDSKNMLSQTILPAGREEDYSINYIYDNGKLVDIVNSYPYIQYEYEYTFDKNNNMICSVEYYDGDKFSETHIEYNRLGQQTKQVTVRNDGTEQYRTEYEYTSKGVNTSMRTWYEGVEINSFYHRLNDKDECVESLYFSNGSDEPYLRVEKTYLEYDEHGNWTLRLLYNSIEDVRMLQERTIEYYE